MRRAYHRILGMPQIRPEGLCFRATLKAGRATANPITWPFRSAKQTRSGTTIGLSCFAKWSISALVSGTNPQFRSHAWLYSALTSSTSSLKRFMLSGRSVMPLRCAMTRSEEHTSELQSQSNLVCRLLLEKKIHNDHTCCKENQTDDQANDRRDDLCGGHRILR